ncbi:MAG: ATP-binding cassette domain-containing protein [Propionibacteriaceae bacterium]|nr:ATP-binding cassette domain-containing protein [Propionibacteriaceae bacterium]
MTEAGNRAVTTAAGFVTSEPIVPEYRVRGLTRLFRQDGTGAAKALKAVDGVDFEVWPGQRLGIVGESGSGKSTLIRMLSALQLPSSGTIEFRGKSIVGLDEEGLGELRSSVQLVFQDPRSSLNPRWRVGRIIAEPLRSPLLRRTKRVPLSAAGRRDRLFEVMDKMGLDRDMVERYPHEFSGGQRQRIAIARALAPKPSVLIADEAVSALDVSVRAHVLNIITDRVRDDGLTLLFVSHDLSVVRHVCDSVIVMRAGRIVEAGPVEQVYEAPQERYTRELLAAVPRIRTG